MQIIIIVFWTQPTWSLSSLKYDF